MTDGAIYNTKVGVQSIQLRQTGQYTKVGVGAVQSIQLRQTGQYAKVGVGAVQVIQLQQTEKYHTQR